MTVSEQGMKPEGEVLARLRRLEDRLDQGLASLEHRLDDLVGRLDRLPRQVEEILEETRPMVMAWNSLAGIANIGEIENTASLLSSSEQEELRQFVTRMYLARLAEDVRARPAEREGGPPSPED